MKAIIEGVTYNVDQEWEIIERLDEQFDSGFLTIISLNNKPFPSYTYVVLQEGTKEWHFFVQDGEETWFDREDDVWNHSVTLIELTQYFTLITTPVIKFTQPLDGSTLNYPNLKSMVDRIYNVTFTEIDGANLGFDYTAELLNILNTLPGFDYTIPEGNLFTALAYIFNTFNGIPRITKIENGRIVLGVDFQNKVENEIEFDNFDSVKVYNLAKDYATMGESRGLNVVNNGEDANDSSYLYTKETLITVRSVGTVIDEDDMVHEFFYPIKGFKKVQFYDITNLANTVDITFFVVTQDVYETLPTNGFSSGTTDRYKQNCVPYDINGDLIKGWGTTYNRFILPNFVVWKELIRSAQNKASIPVNIPSNFTDVAINANYVAILNQDITRCAKENINTVKRASVLQTNQGGNLVDSKRLGQNLHSDIQRSGNRVCVYSVRNYEDLDAMYNNGDFDLLTDSLITIKKTIGHEDFYTAHYELHEHYQKITTNLDISAKIREYDIPKEGKAIESARFYEDFIEWNLEDFENNNSSFTNDGIEAFLGTFGKDNTLIKKEVDNVELLSSDIVDEDQEDRQLVVPVISNGYRNTMKFFFGFKDPTFAYSRKIADGSLFVKQGIRYTNEEGFLNEVSLNYGRQYNGRDKATCDNLPIAVGGNYDTNPLISIGDIGEIVENFALDPFSFSVGDSSDLINYNDFKEAIVAGGASDTVVDVNYIFNDGVTSGTVTYSILDLIVTGVDFNDTVIDLGTYGLAPNIPLNFTVDKALKSIKFQLIVTGEKDPGTDYIFQVNTNYNLKSEFTTNGLKLDKDPGEITLLTHFVHNVFYKFTQQDIGEIIIGDESMIGNLLVGGKEKSRVDNLFIYESDRYLKNEKDLVKGTQKSNAASALVYGAKSITLSTAIAIASGKSWALGDDNGKLIFAVNPPRNVNGVPQNVRRKISFNFVHLRTGLVREY